MRYKWSLILVMFIAVFFSCDEKTSGSSNVVIGTGNAIDEQVTPPKVLPYNLASRIRSTDDLTFLFAEIEESPILEQLTKETGPFTMFAPSNEAFDDIDFQDQELAIEDVLKKYMVAGKITTVALTKMIRTSGGRHTMKTLDGTALVAYKEGNLIYLKNLKGEKAEIGKSDIVASNGIIHVIKSTLDI